MVLDDSGEEVSGKVLEGQGSDWAVGSGGSEGEVRVGGGLVGHGMGGGCCTGGMG